MLHDTFWNMKLKKVSDRRNTMPALTDIYPEDKIQNDQPLQEGSQNGTGDRQENQ